MTKQIVLGKITDLIWDIGHVQLCHMPNCYCFGQFFTIRWLLSDFLSLGGKGVLCLDGNGVLYVDGKDVYVGTWPKSKQNMKSKCKHGY